MSRILVVGEDSICCALGERLVEFALPGWRLITPPINAGGVTRLVSALPRYVEQALNVQPVLCIADTDGRCAAELVRNWLPRRVVRRFLLRLAVNEAESWVLADRRAAADFFSVPVNKFPQNADALDDPKRFVLAVAARSKKRQMRDEMVAAWDLNKPGTGYNTHLVAFVRTRWNAGRAIEHSPSLRRALSRIGSIGRESV